MNAGDKTSGGEGGIRTLGTGVSPYNGLANRRIRPLCHLSGMRKIQFITIGMRHSLPLFLADSIRVETGSVVFIAAPHRDYSSASRCLSG